MFLLYEYLNSIFAEIVEIKAIYKISSIVQMEEMLSDVRNNPGCCLMVKESGDGYLNFKDRRLDVAYHTFYVMVRAEVLDNNSRLVAKRKSMATGIKLIDRMRADATEYGSQAYGLNENRIDYSELGPIGRNYYGYNFSFLVEQGFVKSN